MAFTYAFIILMIVFFILYVLNFLAIDMADPKSLKRYGSLYEHVKFKQGSKLITNETLLRTILKVMIAGLHAFSFIDATGVCVTGMILYFAFGVYLIASFRINGIYEDWYNVYKMVLFHFFMGGNYIFALAQIPQAGQEPIAISFLIQLLNYAMLVLLFAHAIIELKRFSKELEKKSKDKLDRFNKIYGFEKDTNNSNVDLDVTADDSDHTNLLGVYRHGDLRGR